MGFCSVLAYLGAVTLAVIAYRVANFLRLHYFTTTDLKRKYAKAGDWAVVTGASEGIGYAMTVELARRGFNVCVIARTQSKLEEVVGEVQKYGVQGRAIVFDFATADDASYRSLFSQLDALAIAILVNNVGVNYAYANYFAEAALEDDLRMVKVNCEAPLRMTKYIVPRLQSKRAGAILLLSSFTALTPTPMLATYAGSKAFSLSLGTALAYELKSYEIDVLSVTPNLVVSRMTQGASSRKPRESLLMVGAAAMAKQTLNQLGSVSHTSGHRNHALVESAVNMLPESLVASKLLEMHKGVKRRAERKRAD